MKKWLKKIIKEVVKESILERDVISISLAESLSQEVSISLSKIDTRQEIVLDNLKSLNNMILELKGVVSIARANLKKDEVK